MAADETPKAPARRFRPDAARLVRRVLGPAAAWLPDDFDPADPATAALLERFRHVASARTQDTLNHGIRAGEFANPPPPADASDRAEPPPHDADRALAQAKRFLLADLRQRARGDAGGAATEPPAPAGDPGPSHVLTILAHLTVPPHRAPITEFALVSTERDRRALWQANGHGDEQPVAAVDLVCRCGWSQPSVETPAGTHCVTAIGSATSPRTVLVTDLGFDERCYQRWAAHTRGVNPSPDHTPDATGAALPAATVSTTLPMTHELRATLPHVPGAPNPNPAGLWDDDQVGRKYDAAREDWTLPQPLSLVRLSCPCGWRSEVLDAPAGTRVTYPVTRPDAFEPVVLTSAAFLTACVQRFRAHLTDAAPADLDAAATLITSVGSPGRDTDDEPSLEQHAALQRLLAIAAGPTGQAARVANFLLAWWHADECGGFDLTDVWSLDLPIRVDVATVFALILTHQRYPDSLGYSPEFERVIAAWRPDIAARARADRTAPAPDSAPEDGTTL
jgi:hypothetical protein